MLKTRTRKILQTCQIILFLMTYLIYLQVFSERQDYKTSKKNKPMERGKACLKEKRIIYI